MKKGENKMFDDFALQTTPEEMDFFEEDMVY